MADLSWEAASAQRGKYLSVALKGRGLVTTLGPEDRLKVIDTLIPLFEGVYCHLPQKRAGYAADPVQAEKDFIARQPMGRLATVADITPMVVYLASDESRFVTGQTLLVDGGVTI